MVALWILAALWISVDPLTGTHSGPTARWMGNVSLLLVAAASTITIVWLLLRPPYGPQRTDYTAPRAFELGYQAGLADATPERHTGSTGDVGRVFDLIAGINGSSSQTGT